MRAASELLSDLLSILFPSCCQSCRENLVRNERLICTRCYIELTRTGFHLERDNYVEKLFWGRCNIVKAAVFAEYVKGGIISRLIYRLKYNGIREIGSALGELYGRELSDDGFLDDIDLLVPVPLHSRRYRKRGFNQSLLIAEGIASVCSLPVGSRNLVRRSPGGSQTIRSRIERWQNVDESFQILRPDDFAGLHLLLVDDVITTGSTIDACAEALSAVEGVRISAVALAATLV